MSSQMILGTGRRAENPYYMERFYVNLYSVEELCFLFVDRAELLDAEIVQKGMIRWLEEECSLSDLAPSPPAYNPPEDSEALTP